MANETEEKLEAVARTIHEAVRAWGMAHGQTDTPPWDEAPAWMHESTRNSIGFVRANPGASGVDQHERWRHEKLEAGWTFGPKKDPERKTHPLLVPYADLPDYERRKDTLINAIVEALYA